MGSTDETGSPASGLTLLELATEEEIMAELFRRGKCVICATCDSNGMGAQVHIGEGLSMVLMFGLKEAVIEMVHRHWYTMVERAREDDSD